jgi:DNA polymerase
MEATGTGQKGILIVAEAPGKQEDKKGEQLIGRAGRTLRKILENVGIDLDIDCRKINGVNCRPPKNRTPTTQEIKYCRPNVWKEIKQFKPKIIILLGSVAVESVIGNFWKKDLGGITKWRGWTIPDQKLKVWICPTYHPSYLNYETNPALEKIFTSDIENAVKMLNYSFPDFGDETKKIKIIKDPNKIIKELETILKNKPLLMAYDYETTGLKPHAKGHEIVCCSISISHDSAIVFPMKSNKVKGVFRKILAEPEIKKIAANIKFEESWNRFKLKKESTGWIWDTMIASHVLDNRRLITSLKFQAYIRYGLADYDSHISPFLEADDKKDGANSFNEIHKVDMDDLLLYCGIDSMMEHRLAFDQMMEMGITDPEEFAKTGHVSNFETPVYEEPKPVKKIRRKN